MTILQTDTAPPKGGSKSQRMENRDQRNARFLNILDSEKSANKYRPKPKTRQKSVMRGLV